MINRPKILAHFTKQDVNQLVFMDVPKEHEFHRGLHESRLSKRLDLQSLPFVLDGGLSKKINNRVLDHAAMMAGKTFCFLTFLFVVCSAL